MDAEKVKAAEERSKAFEEAARPLIKWLNDNGHPHMTIIVTPTGAELLSAEAAFQTHDYLRD